MVASASGDNESSALWCVGGMLVSFLTDLLSPEGLQGRFCVGCCLCYATPLTICRRCRAERPEIESMVAITGSQWTPRMPQEGWTCPRCGYDNYPIPH
jgi:hypothetical protein